MTKVSGNFDGRQSRLFLANIGDDLEFDDDSNVDKTEKRDGRASRSKSILISVDESSFLGEDKSDGKVSILDENKVNNSSSFQLKRVLDVDFPPSSVSSFCTESAKDGSQQKQERRRAIKVDEVVWSNDNKHYPTAV